MAAVTAKGRTPAQLTKREKELYRILKHALFCFDGNCSKCMAYEDKLEDGPQHFPEDPEVRLYRLDIVLRALVDQAELIERYLEVAPVPQGARAAGFELADMARVSHKMLTEPIYSSGTRTTEDDYDFAAAAHRPPGSRARKRAVTVSGGFVSQPAKR